VGLPGAYAESGLPPKTAEQLLVDLQAHSPVPLSGTVSMSVDLGIPALPRDSHRRADAAQLASGSHTLRVWTGGAGRSRVSLLATSSQSDVIRDGAVLWTWNSADNAADRYEIPDAPERATGDAPPPVVPSTPQEAAQTVLDSLDPSTEVSTAGTGRVAGRPVYELLLTPRTDATLVRQVGLAVDAENGTPLRVQIFSAEMSQPAVDVGFTSVDFTAPDPSVFDFVPPAGAEVTDHPAPESGQRAKGSRPGATHDSVKDQAQVVGKGWSRVVVRDLGADALKGIESGASAESSSAGQVMAMLDSLPRQSGAWGSGRVFSGTLFSMIVTDDGRVAIGAVPAEALGAALAKV
jgi:outer membrane lipoprotein-sorting protein